MAAACINRFLKKSALSHSYREELSAPRNVAVTNVSQRPLRHAGSPIPPAVEPSQGYQQLAVSDGALSDEGMEDYRLVTDQNVTDP